MGWKSMAAWTALVESLQYWKSMSSSPASMRRTASPIRGWSSTRRTLTRWSRMAGLEAGMGLSGRSAHAVDSRELGPIRWQPET